MRHVLPPTANTAGKTEPCKVRNKAEHEGQRGREGEREGERVERERERE
jgi:hypothetical protein